MPGVGKAVWRTMTVLNVRLYRASKGRVMGKVRGVPVLLLTVRGRKTGAERTTPVSYMRYDDGYVVTGSAGGQPAEPQWFRNLRRAEHAVIEVGPQRMDVTVQVAGPEQRKVLWDRLIASAPFFAKYQSKVEREIPMAVLTPR
jgi:F420H(2)-dependent quinone reductase